MDTIEKKKNLRDELLERRKALSEERYRQLSAQIVNSLRTQPEFREATSVHCYISMNDRQEVDTHELVRNMLSMGKGVVVPVTNFSEGTLRHFRLHSFGDLEPNKWGVLEPNEGEEVSPDELEVVIVPMVGGDEQCNRIGYGKGFYDRFLEKVSCPKIGLTFDRNVIEEIPVEHFDVPMDKIITDRRVIQCD